MPILKQLFIDSHMAPDFIDRLNLAVEDHRLRKGPLSPCRGRVNDELPPSAGVPLPHIHIFTLVFAAIAVFSQDSPSIPANLDSQIARMFDANRFHAQLPAYSLLEHLPQEHLDARAAFQHGIIRSEHHKVIGGETHQPIDLTRGNTRNELPSKLPNLVRYTLRGRLR